MAPFDAEPSMALQIEKPADDEIVKPADDKRSYRRFMLPNALNCVVISEAETLQMAANLSVSVGYFNDPVGLEGTSNLIGNQKYKEFSQYIHQNNGTVRGCTTTERTTFSFNASSDVLAHALARFSEFFVEQALVSADAIMEDSQSESNLKEEYTLNELQKHVTDYGHPFHKFRSDNWKLVAAKAKNRGLDLRKTLQDFFEKSYSANMVALVVYGKESLDEMQSTVEKHFGCIGNRKVQHLPFETHPCGDQFRKIVKVAVTNARRLTLQWPLIRNICEKEATDACAYLTHLFGYDTEGSPFHILKQLGWSTDANASEMDCNSHFSISSICIELTTNGHEHFEDVCGLIFQYIKMLKKDNARKFIFEELRAVSLAAFNSGVVSSSLDHVDNICGNMLVFPPAEWLTGSKVPSRYSVQAIRKVVKGLSLENVRIFLECDKVEGQHLFNGVRYSDEAVPSALLKMWMDKSPAVNMHLPAMATVALKAVNEKAPALHNFQRSPVKKSKELKGGTIKEKRYALRNRQKIAVSKRDEKCEFHVEKVSDIQNMKLQLKSDTSVSQAPAPHPQVVMERNVDKVCVIYDKRMLKHIPPREHYEKPERLEAIYEKLELENLLERCAVYDSELARLKYVLRVHEDNFFRSILSERTIKDDEDDMYFGEDSLDTVLLAAGGTIKACMKVATGEHSKAFAMVRPPGHHAKKTMCGGFCFFNNVAIGAKYLMKKHEIKKVLILDWDFHFGDGTEDVFRGNGNVLVVSMHRLGVFPCEGENPSKEHALPQNVGTGVGAGYNCNVCWNDPEVGDDDLYAVFDYIIMPLTQEFKPEIILISAGFDAAKGDLVGDCWLTHVGYATALYKLLQLNLGIVLVLEGGYNLDVLGECCASCVRVLSGDFTTVDEKKEYFPLSSTWDVILELRGILSCYWESLKPEIPADILARKRPNHKYAKKRDTGLKDDP